MDRWTDLEESFQSISPILGIIRIFLKILKHSLSPTFQCLPSGTFAKNISCRDLQKSSKESILGPKMSSLPCFEHKNFP